MKSRMLSLAALSAFALGSINVNAAPIKLTKIQMDQVVAGAITKINGGGNTPNGNANGVPSKNPAGYAPPGQNK